MRRTFLLLALSLVTLSTLAFAGDKIEVWKDPSCGCCNSWISYMKQNGYEVTSHNDTNMDTVKEKLGVPSTLASCHTGVIKGKVIEGHVTVSAIQKAFADKKDFKGLTVPGMVLGSPGMEGPTTKPYQVLAFDAQGKTQVVEQH